MFFERKPTAVGTVRWQDDAACREAETSIFLMDQYFPGTRELEQARSVCHSCAVRPQCLDYAISTSQDYGIWGGMTAQERLESVR